jgi:hypothetical protein
MTAVREVFDSIAYCKNVALCQHGDESHPCAKIVRSQHVSDDDFQLPGPWRGQIDKARILFVGSNLFDRRRSVCPSVIASSTGLGIRASRLRERKPAICHRWHQDD